MSTVKFKNKSTGTTVSFTPKPGQTPPKGGWKIKQIATAKSKVSKKLWS